MQPQQPPQQPPQPPLTFGQPDAARALARQGCAGCLRQVRGCVIVVVALAVLCTGGLWGLSLVTHIPLFVFYSPLPYLTQYHFVVHQGQTQVYAVVWSPDGKRIASGSSEQDTVQVWDAASGRTLFSYQAPRGKLAPLAWSPDGSRLALADLAHPLMVLDGATGKTAFAVSGTGGNLSIAWSPDGKQIAAVDPTFVVRVWDASSGQVVSTLQGARADEVAWSPSGKQLASVGDGSVHVWEVASGRLLLSSTRKSVLDVTSKPAWSPDGKRVAAQILGAAQVYEQVWDVASGHTVFSYAIPQRNEAEIVAAWSPDSRHLAISSGADRSVGVWDVGTGKKVLTYGGHELTSFNQNDADVHTGIQALAWSPDGKRIVSLGTEETVQIWDPTTAVPDDVYDTNTSADLFTFHGRYATNGARAVAWSPDGKRVAIGGSNFAEIWTP